MASFCMMQAAMPNHSSKRFLRWPHHWGSEFLSGDFWPSHNHHAVGAANGMALFPTDAEAARKLCLLLLARNPPDLPPCLGKNQKPQGPTPHNPTHLNKGVASIEPAKNWTPIAQGGKGCFFKRRAPKCIENPCASPEGGRAVEGKKKGKCLDMGEA